MFTYNINDKIKVKLTEYGKAILQKHVADTMSKLKNLNLPDDYFPYPEGEDDYTEFQLWDFMSIFGSHFFVGCHPIIEHNKIIFVDEVN